MRINDSTVEKLESLSQLTGESKQKLMDQAVLLYTYEQTLRTANKQYAALKKDAQAWKEMEEEREDWDVTLKDGLKDDKS